LYIYLDLLVLSLYFGAAARGDTWILVGFYWARSCTACFFCTQFPIIRAWRREIAGKRVALPFCRSSCFPSCLAGRFFMPLL